MVTVSEFRVKLKVDGYEIPEVCKLRTAFFSCVSVTFKTKLSVWVGGVIGSSGVLQEIIVVRESRRINPTPPEADRDLPLPELGEGTEFGLLSPRDRGELEWGCILFLQINIFLFQT